MLYDEIGRLIQRKVNGALEAKWYYDNTDTHKGLGLLDFEDSQFRPDGSRLQKFYYYSDATSGRKDLLQVTHRFYENDDQNDFVDYATQYFTDGFYARPKGLRYPGGTSLAYDYNANGHVIREKDPTSSVIYREITARSSRNQITSGSVANHTGSFSYQLTADFYAETGQAKEMIASNGSTAMQDLDYTYDHFGNLLTRQTNVGSGATEAFVYDDLQRLTQSTRVYVSGAPTDIVNYAYDKSGTFTSKGDYATAYNLHTSRPHVVTSVNKVGGGTLTFSYDENGNVKERGGDDITYNAFNKPIKIHNPSTQQNTEFTYGADLMRYRQITPTGSTIYYLDKLMEIEATASSVDYRHYLGDLGILTKTGSLSDPNPGIDYFFRDRLGGISMIGDETGLLLEYRAYDAFGKPRNSNWSDKSTPTISSTVTDRGFTDHEHLDDWQLIHMNGRGYDYNFGRFLSVDPFIQDPGNSQSINAYAYIMNNPLSGTDPSGYQSICETGSRLGRGVTSPCAVITKNGPETTAGKDNKQKNTADNGFQTNSINGRGLPDDDSVEEISGGFDATSIDPEAGGDSSPSLQDFVEELLNAPDVINLGEDRETIGTSVNTYLVPSREIFVFLYADGGVQIATVQQIREEGILNVVALGVGGLAGRIGRTSRGQTSFSGGTSPPRQGVAPKDGSSGGPGANKAFSAKVKDQARVESNNTCVFCGVETVRSKVPHPNRSNIDHADPRSRGGNNTQDNAQNTCQTCNLDKGAMTTQEYLEVLRLRGDGDAR